MSDRLEIGKLTPHPKNRDIYGDEDISELAEQIEKTNWIKPIVINPQKVIISGHRRYYACLKLGIKKVPIEMEFFDSKIDEIERLLLENQSREKTRYQKAQEGKLWEEIVSEKAKERMKLGTKIDPSENFPKGRTNDIVAEKVGLGSGKTYEKAKKVAEKINDLKSEGSEKEAQFMVAALEESISSAKTIMDSVDIKSIPEETKDKVINKKITVKDAVKEIKRDLKETVVVGNIQSETIEEVKEESIPVIETITTEKKGFDYESLLQGFKTLTDTFMENMKIYANIDEEVAENMDSKNRKDMEDIASRIEKIMGKIKSNLV